MSAIKLDRMDVRILEILQKEGRITTVELADRIGLSPTPCTRRLHRLESEGVIAGYCAVLNRKYVGFGVTAIVHINIDKHGFENTESFRKAIEEIPEIVSCHALAGSFDFILEVVAEDLEHYSNTMLHKLGDLPGVSFLQSTFSLRRMKDHAILPLSRIGTNARSNRRQSRSSG